MTHTGLTDATLLPRWLEEQTALYIDDPCGAETQLPVVLDAFELIDGQAPDRFGVKLAILAFNLATEYRLQPSVARVVDRALAWCEAGVAPDLLARVLCMRAHIDIMGQRFERVTQDLNRALTLALDQRCPLSRASMLATLAQLELTQANLKHVVTHSTEAIALFKGSGRGEAWVQVYGPFAIALRDLGDHTARRAALLEGIAECVAQRRWHVAANLCTGLVDMALESGELDLAEQELARCQDWIDRTHCSKWSFPNLMVVITGARLMANRGQFYEASECMRQALDAADGKILPSTFARCCEQMADWLALANEPQAALTASRRAHSILKQQAQANANSNLTVMQQRLALERAEAERAATVAFADELSKKNYELEQLLMHERTLQAELVESSRLASLGKLLAGMAHEINTPLGVALTAISTVAEVAKSTSNELMQGAITRSRLNDYVAASAQGAALAQRNLERACELVEGYKALNATLEASAPIQLSSLIRKVYAQALASGTVLELSLDVAPQWQTVLPVDTFVAVLTQLFQNTERHAYAQHQSGKIEVRAWEQESFIHLTVADHGCGIAADILPRIFEPYTSTQFGRGRSGLGLFIAQTLVAQKMKGRIHAVNRPDAGCQFEMVWPAAAR